MKYKNSVLLCVQYNNQTRRYSLFTAWGHAVHTQPSSSCSRGGDDKSNVGTSYDSFCFCSCSCTSMRVPNAALQQVRCHVVSFLPQGGCSCNGFVDMTWHRMDGAGGNALLYSILYIFILLIVFNTQVQFKKKRRNNLRIYKLSINMNTCSSNTFGNILFI